MNRLGGFVAVLHLVALLGCSGSDGAVSGSTRMTSPGHPGTDAGPRPEGDAGSPAGDGAAGARATDSASPEDAGIERVLVVPTITASISPETPSRATGVTASVHLSSGPVGWSAHWTWEGPTSSVSGDVVKLTDFAKGETWTLRAWGTDPQGDRVDAPPLPFTVADSPPGAAVVTIVPSSPLPGDALAATLESQPTDPDGDPVTIDYEWLRDGAPTSLVTSSVPAGTTRAHEVWRVTVRVYQTSDPSLAAIDATAEVAIGVLAPTAPVVAIVPSAPNVGDALQSTLTTSSTDPNGEAITYAYRWLRNAAPTAYQSDAIAAGITGPHEQWTVEVVAKNSGASSQPGTAIVTMANRPPSPGAAALSPATVMANSTVRVTTSGASDPDSDSLTYSYAWLVNDVPVSGQTSSSLVPGAYKRGDSIVARVTVSDGYGGSASTDSPAIVVANTPPAAPTSAQLTNPFPHGIETSGVTASFPAADVDGDPLSMVVEWFLDDVSTGQSATTTRSNSDLRRGVWTARVAVSDGTATSAFVDVPGTLTLCPDPAPSTPSLEYAQVAAWDARSCLVHLYTSDGTFLQTQAFDPRTGLSVTPVVSYDPVSTAVLNLRAYAAADATVDTALKQVTLWWRAPRVGVLGWKYTATASFPPYVFATADIVGRGATRDSARNVVVYAVFEGTLVGTGARRVSVYRATPETGGFPTRVDVTVGSMPSLVGYARSAYHQPTDEVMIGPITNGTKYQIWAVHASKGTTRLVHEDVLSVGWNYDPWIQKYTAFAPYSQYGFGSLDPTTGTAAWRVPTRGFTLPKWDGIANWDDGARQRAGFVPATGDMLAVFQGAGVVRWTSQTSSLSDVTVVPDYAAWTASDQNEAFHAVARTATGTVIIYPGSSNWTLLSMARVFERDPKTGSVTWLAPAADSELPNWPMDAAVAYDPGTDSLMVQGGGISENEALGGTWQFLLASHKWKRLSSAGPARVNGALVVDTAHQRLVYYGGRPLPIYPKPAWSNSVSVFDLATSTWSGIADPGPGTPPNFEWATAAVDSTGDTLYVGGVYYVGPAGQAVERTAVWSRKLSATGGWSGTTLPSSGMFPAITSYWGALIPTFETVIRAAPSARAFVVAGRGCTNDVTVLGYGLMELSWDTPSLGWQWAVNDATFGQLAGHLGYDDPAGKAYSVWPLRAENLTVCHDSAGGRSILDRVFTWP
jgi:hypothetical protein